MATVLLLSLDLSVAEMVLLTARHDRLRLFFICKISATTQPPIRLDIFSLQCNVSDLLIKVIFDLN